MLQTKRTGIVPQSSTEHTATASAYLRQRVECDWPTFHIVIPHTPLINVKFLNFGIMNHRFQVYSSDLTKGGEVAFHHGRRIPEGKILEHLSS